MKNLTKEALLKELLGNDPKMRLLNTIFYHSSNMKVKLNEKENNKLKIENYIDKIFDNFYKIYKGEDDISLLLECNKLIVKIFNIYYEDEIYFDEEKLFGSKYIENHEFIRLLYKDNFIDDNIMKIKVFLEIKNILDWNNYLEKNIAEILYKGNGDKYKLEYILNIFSTLGIKVNERKFKILQKYFKKQSKYELQYFYVNHTIDNSKNLLLLENIVKNRMELYSELVNLKGKIKELLIKGNNKTIKYKTLCDYVIKMFGLKEYKFNEDIENILEILSYYTYKKNTFFHYKNEDKGNNDLIIEDIIKTIKMGLLHIFKNNQTKELKVIYTSKYKKNA